MDNSRDRALIVVLGAALAIVAGWFFWLSPVSSQLQAANASVNQLTTQKATLSNELTFVQQTTSDLTQNPDVAKLLTLAAPSGTDMSDLVASFDAMATTSGVSLTSVQPQPATAGTKTLTLTLGVTGTYGGMESFVAAMESNERPLAIQSVSLANGAGANGSNLLTGTFSVSTIQGSTSSASTTGGTQ